MGKENSKKVVSNALLWSLHIAIAAGVIGATFLFWDSADFTTKWGFVLAVLGILLSSAGALVKPGISSMVLVLICLGASAFSAYLFVNGLEDQQKNGPRLGNVSLKFIAAGYDVKLMDKSGQPCSLADRDASTYVCNVTVTPLAQSPASKPLPQ